VDLFSFRLTMFFALLLFLRSWIGFRKISFLSDVRTIKPNDLKKAAVFDDEMNLHQIRYLGLLENVRVRRAGFAFRQTFGRFVARYKMLAKQTWPNSHGIPPPQACRIIMQELSISEGQQFQMGSSKIFIRQPISLFTLEELRERRLHVLATMIQSVYRSYRARKWAREMREKSLGLFGRNKLRRRASVRRYYVGDYLRLADNPLILKLLAKYKETGSGARGGSTILFADEIDKINRKAKTQRRVLLLTSQAVYNLGVAKDKFKENRRLEVRAVTRVSVSKQADNFVVLHAAAEYDYVVICERKTEFLTALSDAYKTLTGGSTLPIDFNDEIQVSNKNKSKQKISFVKNGVQNGVTHAADKENIVVTVGKLDTVNEAYLKALEPVLMKKTDPKLKPKPGYVARNEPTKVRGISVTGGHGGQANSGSLYGQNKVVAGSSSSSSASASASAARAAPAPPAKAELWARAVEDFVGSDSRELTFNKGDELRILSQDESGWWSSERHGVLGYAPSTYLEIIVKPTGRK
jgi:myosin-1